MRQVSQCSPPVGAPTQLRLVANRERGIVMSLSDIIIELIKEMQLNETELEEIKQFITNIQSKQPQCYAEEKKEE